MRSIRFFLLAAWLCLSLGAFAQTTYYVGPSGVDAPASGTEAFPYKTIGYAVNQLQEGELNAEIVVLGSETPYTYLENTISIDINVPAGLTIRSSGENITISPAEGISPLISITANDVTIEGLNLLGNEIANGIVIESSGNEDVSNTLIQQNAISGFANGVLVAQQAQVLNLNIINNTIDANSTGINLSPRTQISNLSISNNFINSNGNGIIVGQPIQLNAGIIYSNDLSQNSNKAVVNNANNVTVNASANWWGDDDFEDVVDQTIGRVDYNPWITDEDDLDNIGTEILTSFSNLGIKKTNATEPVLQEAYNLVEEGGEITIYFTDAMNRNYEPLTINKELTLIGKASAFFDPTNSNVGLPKISSITVNETDINLEGPIKILDGGILLNNGNIDIEGVLYVSNQIPDLNLQVGTITGVLRADPFNLNANEELSFLGVTIFEGDASLGQVTIARSTGTAARNTDNPRLSSSIEVIWSIEATNEDGLANGRDVRFSWNTSFETNDYEDTTVAIVWKREGEAEAWQQVAVESTEFIAPSTRSVTIPVTSFSLYTVGGVNEPLPVELTSFSASLLEPHVELNWETASEINSDFFAVERSENGKDFKEVGRLKAAGDSDVPLEYRYIDEQVANRLSGSVFYRLRTVDFDGSFEYSDITTVTLSDDDIPMITAFAREGQQSLKLFTRAIEPGDYRVWITDLSGRKVFEQDLQLAPKESYELGVGNLTQSIYLIRCEGRQLALSNKFRVEEMD